MVERFQLRIATEDDFPEIYAKLWEAFENPFQGVLRLFFPIVNNDRAESLKACIAGQLDEWRQNQPNLVWVKVVDTHEGGEKLVAAAKWFFYPENPHTGPHVGQVVADWYPEGIGREFATLAARQFERPRETMATRAHAFLHIAFADAEYRGRGLGRLLMDWGTRIADERGLEAWLDASEFGAPLYEKYGFRPITVNRVKPVPQRELSDEEAKEWKFYEETLLPIDEIVMWRPPKGVFVEGETVVPWEKTEA
ncbi:putative GNAT family acetyltransferase [Aspergillus lucknowensis]|uniref:GNAT family acetyltransferase n=1 Tax=Aspergillus lucknowensis TaxID=176173 RepID=A0ABR4LTS0_9EURO